ncbi:hypothetical protein C8R43DRAFT_445931 [Mycena crocata]|nr:hypothetical protein C8R43DRAFT_445931 [Mycena crocata]
MPASLLYASPEVLRDIVLRAVGAVGPPHEWYSMVLCCKAFRRQLDTVAMHTLLFAQKFHAPVNVYHPLLPVFAAEEMKRRFLALKLFRRGERCLDERSTFTDALWVAYVMLRAEEPRQMNVNQLLWAGLPELLFHFLGNHLNDGADHGWPLCDETNSLVLALMWLLSSESSVGAETSAIRDEIMERLKPYVLAAFRYPLSTVQEWFFDSNTTLTSTAKPMIVCLPPSPSSKEVAYFGPRTVRLPSAPMYSILSYFARLDSLSPMLPVHLLSTASAPPKTGPRREDVINFIRECRTQFEPWDFMAETPGPSTGWIDQPYMHGALTGRWKGSSILPCINQYRHWKDDTEAPDTMDTFCRQPLYLTLQEHFCYTAETACTKVMDAWFPASWAERDDGIEVFDEPNNVMRFYETGIDNAHIIRPENIMDVIVTGQTDDPYASAWGAFKVFGRVRLSDGLIVLRRESVTGLGTTLLQGYMASPKNFAGRYRAIDRGCGAAEWEAAFSLCKADDNVE